MELKDILLYVLVGALVVLELYKYLKRRAEGATIEEAGTVAVDVLENIIVNFNNTIHAMGQQLRDSIPQETFNDFLRYNDKFQEKVESVVLDKVSQLLEDFVKTVDHDPTNDPVADVPTDINQG